MFADLKSVVDLIRTGISDYRGFKSKNTREKTILDILKTYFLFLDCVEEGERLILAAGPNPIEKIRAMGPDEASAVLDAWDLALRKQNVRLQVLQGYIFGQDHLAVIDPALQKQISKVVGDKSDTNSNLAQIGAQLFFRSMFARANSNEERAEYVLVMAGAEGDTLDIRHVETEQTILEIKGRYREVVPRLSVLWKGKIY